MTWAPADRSGDRQRRFHLATLFWLTPSAWPASSGSLDYAVSFDGPHRTSKFAFVQLVDRANRVTASAFFTALVKAVPCKIHTVLTDNGIQFRPMPRYADGPTARFVTHLFAMRCRENGIEHRFTKIGHPWTDGQVERMNRAIKEATVQRYHYDSHTPRPTAEDPQGVSPRTSSSAKHRLLSPERFILNPLQ